MNRTPVAANRQRRFDPFFRCRRLLPAQARGTLPLILAGLLAALAPAASAGGIDRSGQTLGALFEPGHYLEISFKQAMPSARGSDLLGGPTGDTTGDYQLPGISLKLAASEKLSLALVAEQTYGADIRYADSSRLLGGTLVDVRANALLGLARWRFNERFSIHGGWRTQSAQAHVRLQGLAYGPVNGYDVRLHNDTAHGTVAGLAYEIPEAALRIAASFHSAIEHRLETRESAPLAPLNGSSTTTVRTPQAVNLDFQTGIANDTLLFGQLRWAKWSEFRVDPERFAALTGEGLIELRDTRSWTLGLARRFTSRWSGAVSLHYEERGSEFNSPLSPVNGRRGLSLAAIYQLERIRITTGLSYTLLGDAQLETGTPDVQRASMRNNSALGLGVTFGFGF